MQNLLDILADSYYYRGIDTHQDQLKYRWLIELPLTDEEYELFDKTMKETIENSKPE